VVVTEEETHLMAAMALVMEVVDVEASSAGEAVAMAMAVAPTSRLASSARSAQRKDI
jgi:hypothetical protein